VTPPAAPSRGFALSPTPAGRLACALLLAAALATCPLGAEPLEMAVIVAVAAVLGTSSAGRLLRVLPAALAVLGLGLLPVAVTASPELAALAFVRGLASVVAAVAIAGSIPLTDLGPALRGLGAPAALAAVVTSALRGATVLRDEGSRLLLARRLRGAATYRGTGALLGTLLARALSRAERVELSMELRGFRPEDALARSRLAPGDAPPIAISAVAGASVHLIGHIHG
jgi:cobalt/nickel transport system permease protein